MRHLYRFLCLALVLGLTTPLFDQQPPQGTPQRIRGTVEKLEGQNLTVKTREGPSIVIALAPTATIRSVVKRSLSDIKAGDFVASSSVPGADGKLRALELHIFLDAQKGVVPEGQLPWDLAPNSVMTNATVTGVTAAPQGQTLMVTYRGTPTEVIVPPETPIVTYGAGDMSLLKSGAAVFVMALKREDGTYTSGSVTAEKDGVKPPM
jgi:hypothetical protein